MQVENIKFEEYQDESQGNNEYDVLANLPIDQMATDISPMKGNKWPTISSARQAKHFKIESKKIETKQSGI